MDQVVRCLLGERMAWLPIPELSVLLVELADLYDAILATISMDELMAKKYEIHVTKEDDPLNGTGEPDDGIFLKYPKRKDDPSAIRDGVPCDFKVSIQTRLRLENLLKKYNLYSPVFGPFLATMYQVRKILDAVIEDFLDALARERPDIGRLRHNPEATLVRCVKYLGPRSDGSGLAAKLHTDQNDVTIHLWDNREGLVVKLPTGELQLIPTRPGMALLFPSDRFKRVAGIEQLAHGAKHSEGRRIVVAFVHLIHP